MFPVSCYFTLNLDINNAVLVFWKSINDFRTIYGQFSFWKGDGQIGGKSREHSENRETWELFKRFFDPPPFVIGWHLKVFLATLRNTYPL